MMNTMKTLLEFGAIQLTMVLWLSTPTAAEPAPSQSSDSIHHVDAWEAQKLVTDKSVVVLDIRTPQEFNQGRIAGAKNIDFLAPDFEQRIETLDKSKSYLVHCASGGRSTHSLA